MPDLAEIDGDLLPIMDAWNELLPDRPPMGGLIPWMALSRWCSDHGIGGEERLRWIRLIRACDRAHLMETHAKDGDA